MENFIRIPDPLLSYPHTYIHTHTHSFIYIYIYTIYEDYFKFIPGAYSSPLYRWPRISFGLVRAFAFSPSLFILLKICNTRGTRASKKFGRAHTMASAWYFNIQNDAGSRGPLFTEQSSPEGEKKSERARKRVHNTRVCNIFKLSLCICIWKMEERLFHRPSLAVDNYTI